jgi:hypothetical protein
VERGQAGVHVSCYLVDFLATAPLVGGHSFPAARIAANSMTADDNVRITVAVTASNWAGCPQWPKVAS